MTHKSLVLPRGEITSHHTTLSFKDVDFKRSELERFLFLQKTKDTQQKTKRTGIAHFEIGRTSKMNIPKKKLDLFL